LPLFRADGRPHPNRGCNEAWKTSVICFKYESGKRRLDVVKFIEIAAEIGFDPENAIKGL